MNKIEFYKNRSLSERFSVSIDFLKQNWKVLYKNILIGALPLVIIGGYFMQHYQRASFTGLYFDSVFSMLFLCIYYIVLIIMMIYLNAMTGAVLIKYNEGSLTPEAGWRELSGTMFSLSRINFLIGLIVWGIFTVAIFAVAIICAFLFSGISTEGGMTFLIAIVVVLIVFVLLGIVLTFTPFLALAHYPAYFSGAGIWESIKIAFGMGFRNWGNVIVTLILSGIIIGIVSAVFSIPNLISMFFFGARTNILTFTFSSIAILGTVLTAPIMFIFVAFQYFSIVESEQGISLQSKVDEFENL